MFCHPECKVQEGMKTCTGRGADECVACANLQDGPHCVPACPEGVMGGEGIIFKYANKNGRCESCHTNCTQGCFGPRISDCVGAPRYISGQATTAIVLGVVALLFAGFSIFVLTVLYRRGLAIRRKRAMRRYMASGESFEPLDPGEKGPKVQPRFLKPTELRKIKLLGSGIFGSVHKGVWIPEGDTVKLPVAIKTIHDRTGRHTFFDLTDQMVAIGTLDHINVVRVLGICPGASLQLVSQLSTQGSLLDHVRNHKNKLQPQRLLNWCVQIAKGMYYLEENRMVHRNLAARNVLLKNNYTAQISDYGIADLLYPDDKKYVYNEVKTPIKWMALESILFRRYTHQSDVWSYGVTIWEMMSYGVEPYANMRPQEVPDLLEKGERLSQPQICTIDVYMVMVKCWMIDENVRPTFKELASEFTRMARDPNRFLVIREDCIPSDSASDELAQRSVDLDGLDDLDIELEEQVEQVMVDGMNPAIHYMTPSRSFNGLSKTDTPRLVVTSPGGAGYLPMTPGFDNPSQAMWQSRSRLDSARTVSESSEGAGTGMEQETSEDPSLVGIPKRRYHREDSAYVSQRDSMSGGPPETPDTEEEDQYGYVLPGDSPERDTLLCPHGSPRRMGKSRSGGLLDDADNEEYEYMNRQTSVASSSSRSNSHLIENGSWFRSNSKRTSSMSSQATASSLDIPPATSCSHSSNSEHTDQKVEYEYMDIRCGEKDDSPPAQDPPSPPKPTRTRVEEAESEDEYVEDSNYHYTNRQPKLGQALRERKELTVPGNEDGEAYEYEDMDSFAAARPGDAGVYQNLQDAGTGGSSAARRAGFDAYVKVQAGVGIRESAVADRSFDNPDYWHSRIFQKSKPVST